MLTLYIGNKNYSSWSMRPWVLLKQAGIAFDEVMVRFDSFNSPDSEFKRAILAVNPGGRVPVLVDDGFAVWDTLAIAEYLNEIKPKAQLLPADIKARAHCRAICGEMHSGFASMRSSLPMNIKARFPAFKVWSRAQGDIDRVLEIWKECLATYGGPYLFGKQPTVADAMYAPVVTRFLTYDVAIDKASAGYCKRIMELPAMKEWIATAKAEPDEIDELDAEF